MLEQLATASAAALLQVNDLAHDAVREQVPGLVAATISSHVPAMIDEVRAVSSTRQWGQLIVLSTLEWGHSRLRPNQAAKPHIIATHCWIMCYCNEMQTAWLCSAGCTLGAAAEVASARRPSMCRSCWCCGLCRWSSSAAGSCAATSRPRLTCWRLTCHGWQRTARPCVEMSAASPVRSAQLHFAPARLSAFICFRSAGL